jgi:hypothetical protein
MESEKINTHWMPLQEMQMKVQKLVHTYCGPCIGVTQTTAHKNRGLEQVKQ